ncbi:MAG: tetratricopeptide repeat protein [Planctomycetota bacterium]|nr:tetratricopeptide repeat protein [Planctomycetota bacterium]MDA1106406.1 tetratricopeptide repeat protein [Planctomycetota bacterium]
MTNPPTLETPSSEVVAALASAESLERSAKFDAAISTLEAVLTAGSRHPAVLLKLAYLLDIHGDDAAANAVYEEIVHLPHPPVRALINQAIRFEDGGEYRRARRCLERVLSVDPSNQRARLYLRNVQGGEGAQVFEPKDEGDPQRNALFDVPVTDIDLSLRARNCLRKMNIRTLGDLVRVTEAELLAYRNFGDQSLDEIKRALSQKDLSLGQSAAEKRFQGTTDDPHFAALEVRVGRAVLDTPLSSISLSVRARRATAHLGLRSVGELAMCTEAELMGIKNFGTTSLDELRNLLTERGLDFRPLDG